MDDLLAARLQMAISLGFHIVFAAIGIAMPVLMVLAEWRYNRTGSELHRELTKRWAKGTTIFFAVGAVSGTVLSFELGLLWPTFMAHAGAIIGFPFGLEGFAFFTEAIFLGVYLYAWEKINKWAHLAAGALIAIAGAASALFVIMTNAWMNAPVGFDFDPLTRTFSNIDPVVAMFNPAWAHQVAHMLVAAYMATGFAVAGVHAWRILRGEDTAFNRRAIAIAMALAAPAAIVQPLVGHWSAQEVAVNQPVKLAAMEGQFETETRAPLRLGGIPFEREGVTRYALEIPGLLSFLAFNDLDAPIQGLNEVPREDWPPVAITHVSFQLMVLIGTFMAALAIWWAWLAWVRRRDRLPRALLLGLVVSAPLGFLAIEFGWIVTEVGRQPWIIHGLMRTEDAVSPMPGLVAPFVTFTLVYLGLGFVVTYLMLRQVRATGSIADAEPGVDAP